MRRFFIKALCGAVAALQILTGGVFTGFSGEELQVYAETADDFEINNNTLYAYRGTDTYVRIPEGVKRISSGIFPEENHITGIYIPASVEYLSSQAFSDCVYVEKIEVAANSPNFCVEDGVLLSKDRTTLYLCPRNKSEVSIPDTVTTIYDEAFRGCDQFKEVKLPPHLEYIGQQVFAYCTGLREMTNFPDTLEYINNSAFLGCSNLEKVVLPKNVSLGYGVFSRCTKLTRIWVAENVSFRSDDPRIPGSFPSSTMVYTQTDLSKSPYAHLYRNHYEYFPFEDVEVYSWKLDTALYMFKKGIIKGTSDTTFSPDSSMSRGQFATILWRIEGSEKVSYRDAFSDVTSTRYCAQALQWAKDRKLAYGYADGSYHPDEAMTREQFMVFLYRYAQYKGYDTKIRNNSSYQAVADHETVSSFAVPSMNWGYEHQLIARDGKINAKGKITRIQASAILMRFLEEYDK